MDIVDRIVRYCTDLDPTFAAGMRGSSARDIAAYEQARGASCSSLHRKYLQTMGDGIDAVGFGTYTTSPSRLIDLGPDQLQGDHDGVELFAFSDQDDDRVFLVPDEEGEDAKLAAHPALGRGRPPFDLRIADIVAESLGQLLCLPVFNRCRALRLPQRWEFISATAEGDYLSVARSIGAELGAVEPWFSKGTTYVAETDDLILVAKHAPRSYFSLGVAGDSVWPCIAALTAIRRRFAEAELGLQQNR